MIIRLCDESFFPNSRNASFAANAFRIRSEGRIPSSLVLCIQTLKRISLWQNEITDNGAQHLMNKIGRNRVWIQFFFKLIFPNNFDFHSQEDILLNTHENRLETTVSFSLFVLFLLLHFLIENCSKRTDESNFFGLRSQRTTSRMFADRFQTHNAQPMNVENFWLGLYG